MYDSDLKIWYNIVLAGKELFWMKFIYYYHYNSIIIIILISSWSIFKYIKINDNGHQEVINIHDELYQELSKGIKWKIKKENDLLAD